MNLLNLLTTSEKGIKTQSILRDKASVTLIQIKKDALLKEHQSTTNAMLVLLSGKAVYEEKGRKEPLSTAFDFVRIPEHVTHKVTGIEDAVLMLVQ